MEWRRAEVLLTRYEVGPHVCFHLSAGAQAAADGAFELDAADLGVLDDAWARGRDLLDVVGDVGVEFVGGRRGW